MVGLQLEQAAQGRFLRLELAARAVIRLLDE
jgi:hypothetical protein